MKQQLTILAFIFLTISYGQTADEYLKSGIEKHNLKDFEGAIEEYSKAIKADKNLRDGYFNRGVCELGLKDFKSAKKDFDKTIELDPKFVKAFYSRATVYASQEKYVEALPDLDKTIELDQTLPNALNLRGQIRAQTGNKKGACEDFNKAKKNGDKQADKYLSQFCGNEQQNGESLSLHWPENENWKIGSNQENDYMTMLELIPSNETFENWTEIGTMMSIKGVKNVPMDKAMEMKFEDLKKSSPKAKLTFIEKDESVEYPWIIFTIECPKFKNDKNPESQLWYITQGKTSLYINFRAVKESTVPVNLRDKWIKFFKTATIVYQ
jgi:tetratricopeptide (TPR) repeat protein